MANTGFWWILLATGLYGVFHSLLASQSVKKLAASWFGQPAYQRYYRLFFSLMALLTTLPLLALAWLLPDQMIYVIRTPWVFITLLLQLFAAAALLVGVTQTGVMRFLGVQQMLEGTGEPAPERLIVTGLYRWVRHPLYTAALVLIWLMPLMSWNLLALNLGFSGYMLIGSIFEERKLVEQFGANYQAYRGHTPRILPGWKGKTEQIPWKRNLPGDD